MRPECFLFTWQLFASFSVECAVKLECVGRRFLFKILFFILLSRFSFVILLNLNDFTSVNVLIEFLFNTRYFCFAFCV